MGRAIEVVGGSVSSVGATITTVTNSTGQSTVVRGTDTSKNTWLLGAWAFGATAGTFKLTSPRLHDQVQGIRARYTAALTAQLFGGPLNGGFAQRLYAQDNLTVQMSGGGAEIDVESLLIGYDDLSGVAGRFIDQPTLRKMGQNVVTAEVTVTAVATGAFGGAVAINSTNDNLIANTDYAILGGLVDTRCCSVGIVGVDLGNIKLGFPGEVSQRSMTQNFFEQLSLAFGAPYIPVINSANKSATNIDVQTTGTGGTFIVNLQLVQLAPGTPMAATGAATGASAQPGG